MSHNPRNTEGIVLMLLATLMFSSMDAVARGLVRDYPPLMAIWARYLGQSLIVMAWGMATYGRSLPRLLVTRRPGMQAARSALQLGTTSFFFASLAVMGLAEATALTDISPVLITLGAGLFLGERLGPRRLMAVLAALVGALIIIRPGAEVFSPAALLPLAAASCYAGFALVTRALGPTEHQATSQFYAALFGTLVTTALLPFVWVTPKVTDLPAFAGLAVFGSAAQLFLTRAFSRAEASAIAPFVYSGILFAMGFGMIFYDEWPDRWTVTGALVIVTAGLYVWHRETRMRKDA